MQKDNEWIKYELLESDVQSKFRKAIRRWRKVYAKGNERGGVGTDIIGPLSINNDIRKRNVRADDNRRD